MICLFVVTQRIIDYIINKFEHIFSLQKGHHEGLA